MTIADQGGRAIELGVESFSGKSTYARLPDGRMISYSYDALGRMAAARLTDGAQRLYHYNEPEHTSGTHWPMALTGISEQGPTGAAVRYTATFQYDAFGRAISTEYAAGVNRYSVNYTVPYQQSVVADPHGTQRVMSLVAVQGNLLPISQSQPAGSGCGPSSSAVTYDVTPTSARARTSTTTRPAMRMT